jgi:hypothetical protein
MPKIEIKTQMTAQQLIDLIMASGADLSKPAQIFIDLGNDGAEYYGIGKVETCFHPASKDDEPNPYTSLVIGLGEFHCG